jgi:hypothetical protein
MRDSFSGSIAIEAYRGFAWSFFKLCAKIIEAGRHDRSRTFNSEN